MKVCAKSQLGFGLIYRLPLKAQRNEWWRKKLFFTWCDTLEHYYHLSDAVKENAALMTNDARTKCKVGKWLQNGKTNL